MLVSVKSHLKSLYARFAWGMLGDVVHMGGWAAIGRNGREAMTLVHKHLRRTACMIAAVALMAFSARAELEISVTITGSVGAKSVTSTFVMTIVDPCPTTTLMINQPDPFED